MVKPNRQTGLNSEQYARLKAEMAAPYRGLRQFIYVGFGASALIGAFIFFFQVLAGRDVNGTLPNLALQLGILALMIVLWRKEQKGHKRS
ncbi:DUF3493 domain-containing protein [Chrysosporum bergii ANA360D]|jgi:hypothetical protein|uniref:DUF3493 domain-containing protein n=1 Tax=Chrysosporum bergii ANA360D TaxID=617107 RepID=A0AA43GRK6_9CYAN|nr:DUF3493 domain-containing protein [Chrysosporum bergii]MDH6060340.1 DUF3493 domain-containing protein [Chrysosporum bergii ANA360D]